jgi:hypothetical protein
MMTRRVGSGSGTPSPSYRVANTGMTQVRMTHTTIVAITMTAVG